MWESILDALWELGTNDTIIKFLGSFLIGVFGSVAYVLSVRCGFAGGKTRKEREHLLSPILYGNKVVPLLYFLSGGVMAFIFQLISSVFVPIQSLIIGITWPIFITSYLSGRQSEISKEEREELVERPEKEEEHKERYREGIQNLIKSLMPNKDKRE